MVNGKIITAVPAVKQSATLYFLEKGTNQFELSLADDNGVLRTLFTGSGGGGGGAVTPTLQEVLTAGNELGGKEIVGDLNIMGESPVNPLEYYSLTATKEGFALENVDLNGSNKYRSIMRIGTPTEAISHNFGYPVEKGMAEGYFILNGNGISLKSETPSHEQGIDFKANSRELRYTGYIDGNSISHYFDKNGINWSINDLNSGKSTSLKYSKQEGLYSTEYFVPTREEHYIQKKYLDNFVNEMSLEKRLKFLESIQNAAYLIKDSREASSTISTSNLEIDAKTANLEVGVVTRNNYYIIKRQIGNLVFYDNLGSAMKIASNEDVIISVFSKDSTSPFEKKITKGAGILNKQIVESKGVVSKTKYLDCRVAVTKLLGINSNKLKEVSFELDDSSFPTGYSGDSFQTKSEARQAVLLTPLTDNLNISNMGNVEVTLGELGEKTYVYKNNSNKVVFLLGLVRGSKVDKMSFVSVVNGVETELPAPTEVTNKTSIKDFGSNFNSYDSKVLKFELDNAPDKILIKYKP